MQTRRSKRPLQECELETPKKRARNLPKKSPTKPQQEQPKKNPVMERIQVAKTQFRRSAAPQEIVGRQSQRDFIECFLERHISGREPGSLYICGAPGTGKTVMVEHLLDKVLTQFRPAAGKQRGKPGKKGKVHLVRLNCMSVGSNPKSIYARILEQLGEPAASDPVSTLENLLLRPASPSSPFYVIFLDEIDQLLVSQKNQQILYRIFEWPKMEQNSVALIGIANALDLTKRFLPRLQSSNCEPEYLSFPAYTVDEISQIIKSRLQAAEAQEMMHPMAVELCARKVSAFGDFRKALDICRYAFDLLEQQIRKRETETSTVGEDAENNNSPVAHKQQVDEKVNVKHMVKALDAGFGALNASVSKLKQFTPHQKAIMAVLLLIDRYNKQPDSQTRVDPSLLRAYEIYLNIARLQDSMVSQVTRSEFMDMLISIENSGLVNITRPLSTNTASAMKPAKSASATSTPRQKSKPGTPLNKSVRTPTNAAVKSASRYNSSAGKATPKGNLLDPVNWLVLQVNEEEIKKGISDCPHLVAMLNDGVGDAVFKRFSDASQSF